ncbi:ArsR/SmtB family transcription factor [Parachitinimonas caeni]|uniref:Winged helix-turn-helix domain-containing protein n=1 Tax=Parachitinimonas caeni TaxID=3031301 RepID=A0ABT7DYV5_9NEIS|nr:winged helix-turn-helix domain-containing protein [Parachitinimonas caeni]MDK2125189.1 winged helix-turn-helix domain-containing protein [Parachitinimonas caeni]
MKDGPNIVVIAALIGDHSRADILTALMADRAMTATELANLANISKATASGHLAKLLEAGLLTVEAQGRHRYYRLADEDIAQLLESLMGVAFRTGAVRLRSSPREPALRYARVCYDHLAGEVGVRVYDSLKRSDALIAAEDGLVLSECGSKRFLQLGIDLDKLRCRHRSFCRPCLDWSERRHHLAGGLGAALLARVLELGWAKRDKDSRIIRFHPQGHHALEQWLSAGT